MQQGYIRFVGGPVHNVHHWCRWELTQVWHEVDFPPPAFLTEDAPPPLRRREVRYTLEKLISKRGTVFFEYHADPEQTLHSGEDFAEPLDRELETILFGWFFREAVVPYLR